MISTFLDMSLSPNKILFVFGDARIPQIIKRNPNSFLKSVILENLKVWEFDVSENVVKDGH